LCLLNSSSQSLTAKDAEAAREGKLPVESSTAIAAAVSEVGTPRAIPIATLAQFLRALFGSNY
jgi:hypothetical protein